MATNDPRSQIISGLWLKLVEFLLLSRDVKFLEENSKETNSTQYTNSCNIANEIK